MTRLLTWLRILPPPPAKPDPIIAGGTSYRTPSPQQKRLPAWALRSILSR